MEKKKKNNNNNSSNSLVFGTWPQTKSPNSWDFALLFCLNVKKIRQFVVLSMSRDQD